MSTSVMLGPQDLPEAAPQRCGRASAALTADAAVALGTLSVLIGFGLAQASLSWAGILVTVVSLAAGGAPKALTEGRRTATPWVLASLAGDACRIQRRRRQHD